MLDQRGQLLRAAVGFACCAMPSYDRAFWALRTWLDSWPGIGHVAVGRHRQGFDLQLTQYDDRGWRATFYTTGMEHSPTSAPRRRMHESADMVTDATLLLVGFGLVVGGLFFVVAAYRRWAWLVDPPTRFAWLGGHFLIRHLIGKRAMRYVVFALGVGNMALGLYGILSILLF